MHYELFIKSCLWILGLTIIECWIIVEHVRIMSGLEGGAILDLCMKVLAI